MSNEISPNTQPTSTHPDSASARAADGGSASVTSVAAFVSAVAAAVMLVMVLWLAMRPLATPDLWFHLKAGETYWHRGLWPKTDPMLFTGLASGPVQHEWLFGVFAYLVQQAGGFQVLRVVHGLMVLAVFGLVATVFSRATRSVAATALALVVFVVLAYLRLAQFRPDLWSIAGTLLIYLLLLGEARLSRARVLTCAALFWVWCNAHSLASVGLALSIAAAIGVSLELAILSSTLRAAAPLRAAARTRLSTLSAAIALCVLVGLLNPRGARQLFTFVSSSADTAIWEIDDEWHRFDPLLPGPPYNSASLPLLGWAVADLVLIAFAIASAVRVRALRRHLDSEELSRFDPALFMIASAASGAMLISVRFLWLGCFPLLYSLRACDTARWRTPFAAISCAAGSLALLLLFPGAGGFRAHAGDTPRALSDYLRTPINRPRFADEGVSFLRGTQASGRIFSPYELGAYLGYWLSPRLRTFIDSRTEHYPAEVFEEWKVITSGTVMHDGRSFQRVLDDRKVDWFFGVGLPGFSYVTSYTLDRLEHVSGWLLVFRNAGQAIYLRDVARNRDNLERVRGYYARLGIPFDRDTGFSARAAIAHRVDWAIEQRLVPRGIVTLREQLQSGDAGLQRAAAVRMADLLFVAGDYDGAAAYARDAMKIAVDPEAATIALSALMRAGDAQSARALFETLVREHGSEGWMQRFRR